MTLAPRGRPSAASEEKRPSVVAAGDSLPGARSTAGNTTLAIAAKNLTGIVVPGATVASEPVPTSAMHLIAGESMNASHMPGIAAPSARVGTDPEFAAALRIVDAEVALLASLYEGAFLAAAPVP